MTEERREQGVMGMFMKKHSKRTRAIWAGLAAGLALSAAAEQATAQEILLTGPLAGAPSVRKLRLRREGRFEIAPVVSFTLLDEYQRQIFAGARLNYNFTDWLGFGVWASVSPGPLKLNAGLAERIQNTNANRRAAEAERRKMGLPPSVTSRLTAQNLGPDFTKQLGTMDYIISPQLTLVPFRGKISIFEAIYVDTDFYLFGGAAFVGLTERRECGPGAQYDLPCSDPDSFQRVSRLGIAPTFGLGFTFYVNKWNSFGFSWRGMPLKRNTGGFDNRGGGPDKNFPDLAVDKEDRQMKLNMMMSISYGFYFPMQYRVSE